MVMVMVEGEEEALGDEGEGGEDLEVMAEVLTTLDLSPLLLSVMCATGDDGDGDGDGGGRRGGFGRRGRGRGGFGSDSGFGKPKNVILVKP